MQVDSFDVIAVGAHVLPGEWARSMRAPLAELPQLSQSEEEYVQRFGLDTERHRRTIATRKVAQQRESAEGRRLGSVLVRILSELDGQYTLTSVARTARPLGWRFEIASPRHPVASPFSVDQTTVETLIESEAAEPECRVYGEKLAAQLKSRELMQA